MERNGGTAETYRTRQDRVCAYLAREGIACAYIEDTESRRDPGVRYLTGQPGDALLFLFANGKTILIPWDIHMANAFGHADEMIPYTELGRSPQGALSAMLAREGVRSGERCEIPAASPYPLVLELMKLAGGVELLCRTGGTAAEISSHRMIKDDAELSLIRGAASITDTIIHGIRTLLERSSVSETDVALYIEAEARKLGAEGTGFETLAAGPSRSFGIHAFPPYSAAPFAGPGLSILDFGITYEGYTSDVTLTIARGTLTEAQRKKLELVREAYQLSLGMIRPGVTTLEVARAVDDLFSRNGEQMPHALGHGIGLEAHEAPVLRNRADLSGELKPGMVVTIEPGLYHPETGGVRLENDILVTETGAEVLTASTIIELP